LCFCSPVAKGLKRAWLSRTNGDEETQKGKGVKRCRSWKKVSVNGIDIFPLEKVAVEGRCFADGKVSKGKVSVNGIAIFFLEAQDAAWLASYQWNIRARFIAS